MSNLALAPYVTAIANPTTTAFDADGAYNSLRRMDPLGLEWEALQLKKKGEAIADPAAYLAARTDAMTRAKNEVYQIWTANFKDLLLGVHGNDPVPEKEAKQAADTLAKGLWKSKLAEIDLKFPLNIVESVTTAATKQGNKFYQDKYMTVKEFEDIKLPGDDLLKEEKKGKKRKKGKKEKK